MNDLSAWKTLKSNVTGTLLQNANFIFFVDFWDVRHLVLTTNKGEILQSGKVNVNEKDWKNPYIWKVSNLKLIDFHGEEDKVGIAMQEKIKELEIKVALLTKAKNKAKEEAMKRDARRYKKENAWLGHPVDDESNNMILGSDPVFNGSRWQSMECNIEKMSRTQFKKVNGAWSNWGEAFCQAGIQFRSRICDNPPPQNGGKPCKGMNIQVLQKFGDNGCKQVLENSMSQISDIVAFAFTVLLPRHDRFRCKKAFAAISKSVFITEDECLQRCRSNIKPEKGRASCWYYSPHQICMLSQGGYLNEVQRQENHTCWLFQPDGYPSKLVDSICHVEGDTKQYLDLNAEECLQVCLKEKNMIGCEHGVDDRKLPVCEVFMGGTVVRGSEKSENTCWLKKKL